ncbi:ABC transporter permease [Youngiibacter fragilis]|uniref:Nitrate ABC transporter permease n=1 Tax=Youngiibacter fragilis 232.1 TaxID=994573 RepID=V7I3Y7_9CLOT|nr:ABC transporter permease subunit [Youngiibacter fragilis]ETA79692.1 nitrate ABC transporter permease [Youngiibacter fragilis 232.1]
MKNKVRFEKAISIAFALTVWQLLATAIGKNILLVTPFEVMVRLAELVVTKDFLASVMFSFVRIVSGYLLALAAGSALAALAGKHHMAEVLLWPFMTAIKSVPVASFIILCLIWLSSGSLGIFISFLMVLPIIYTNMLHGIRSTDRNMLEMARIFNVTRLRRLKYIYLPQLKPYIVSACSVSIGLSWKAGIAAEVIGIPAGSIGERLYEAKIYLDSADLFAWTAVIVAVSVLFEKLFLHLVKVSYARLERT